jgi:hypothetical protein
LKWQHAIICKLFLQELKFPEVFLGGGGHWGKGGIAKIEKGIFFLALTEENIFLCNEHGHPWD